MPLTLRNNRLRNRVYNELQAFIFDDDSNLRERIVNIDFKGLDPELANNILPDIVDNHKVLIWENTVFSVDMKVLYTALYAYIKQFRGNYKNAYWNTETWEGFHRVEAADIIVDHIDRDDLLSFLRHMDYRTYSEWLVPIFRYGDNEMIVNVIRSIVPDLKMTAAYRKLLLSLFELSDTDQAMVLHDKIGYEAEVEEEEEGFDIYADPDLSDFEFEECEDDEFEDEDWDEEDWEYEID